jgi:hypothetical protein
VKAIPLWQPYASLIAIGAKRVETRHWPAPATIVGQRVAIHACKTPQALDMLRQEPFARAIDNAAVAGTLAQIGGALPLGYILATAVLARSTQITALDANTLRERKPDEYAFGDYTPGRYAWVLDDVRPLARIVPWVGTQGIFEVPDELVGELPAQGTLL